MLNGITQFYQPPTRFIPARAEQDLEHYIRNVLVNVATHFTNLGRMEAWVKLSAREWSWTSTVHDWTCIWVGALTNWASQTDKDRISNGAHTWWWNMGVACLLFYFFPSHMYSPYPELIATNNSLKDAVWRKEVSLKCCCGNFAFWALFLENPTNFACIREITAKVKKSNNL